MEKEKTTAVFGTAGIVTYNPELQRLKSNIDAIAGQVERVYVFDNGSSNIADIKMLVSGYANVSLILSEENIGIAKALNILSQTALKDNAEWMMTLDHDSIVPEGIIAEFCKYVREDVGIICPVMYDKRRPQTESAEDCDEVRDVEFCITSGSFVNLKIWKKIGGYDDALFIGLVDNDYCSKIKIYGYKILQVKNQLLDHELGTLTPSRWAAQYVRLGKMLGSKKITALSYRRKVSPNRAYYATRNIIYLSKKYKYYPERMYSKRYAAENGISNIIRSRFNAKVIKAVCKGFIDGSRMKCAAIEKAGEKR